MLNYSNKIASLVVLITTTLMFSGLVWLTPKLQDLSGSQTLGALAAGAVGSIVIYRVLARSFFWAFSRYQPIRRIILGKAFLEGTWIGFYNWNNQFRYTIETIDQSSGFTEIRGREFDANGNTRATWSSDTASVDTRRMRLVYMYHCDVFERQHEQQGLGVFTLVCENKWRPPNVLDGYSADLIDGKKDANREVKVGNKAMPDAKALALARTQFGR